MKLRFGVRDDAVSRARAARVADALRAALQASSPGSKDDVAVVPVTEGPTPDAGPADRADLVAALRVALVSGECDAVIHDGATLPFGGPEDLEIVAYLPGREARAALCSDAPDLDALAPGARVLCPDVRVAAQVTRLREGIVAEPTGEATADLVARLAEPDVAAVVVPAADLIVAGDDLSTRHLLDLGDVIPAAGQGTVAIEIRADAPEDVASILRALDDPGTRLMVAAERALMAGLEALPGMPVSAYAERRGRDVRLRARVTNASGSLALTDEATAPEDQVDYLGANCAKLLRGRGAARLLRST